MVADKFSFVPLVALGMALTTLVVLSRFLLRPGSQFARALPKSASASNRTTRVAEAAILFCAAVAILVFTATNTSTGGRLLTLNQLRTGFAVVNVVVALAATVGVIFGVLVALRRSTAAGTLTVTAVLCSYGMMVNGPHELLESLAPKGSAIPDATLTFQMSATDATGAELWINGVKLGALPHETTFEEFLAKVPYWAEEPNELKRDNMDSWLRVPSYEIPGEAAISFCTPWAEIAIPKEPVRWNEIRKRYISDPNERRSDRRGRTYYARVRLGGEWGYASGGTGSSSGGGGRYDRRRASVHFGFIFPERQKRLEKLLDIARLYDYEPPPQWFEAMETYRSDGWLAVRKAVDSEPEISKLLDAWAKWRYELDAVTDPESAWRKFEQICEQARRRQYYMTSDIAGRAVELLVPKLNREKLIRRAIERIRSARLYSWYHWQMNDRLQFGFSYAGEGLRGGSARMSGVWTGGRGGQLSPADYAVAHAVWRLDEILDSQDDTQPNRIESELVQVFVAANFDNTNLLRMAAAVGGPHIEQYLQRQNWRADPKELPYAQLISFYGERVNGWLFLLANLQSPAGRTFRQENEHMLMKMADKFAADVDTSWNAGLDFLFLDKELGDKSLAMRYWPRFRTLPIRADHYTLSRQFKYLLRMEPMSTVDMYVECWRDFRGDSSDFEEALDSFEKLPPPAGKRAEILAGLAHQIENTVGNVTDKWDEQGVRDRLLRILKSHLSLPEDKQHAAGVIAELRAGGSRYTREDIRTRLANARPQNPLLEMLAEADEPELRVLVMEGLREHPIPANRRMLQKLLEDENEQVREAAQRVEAVLKDLREAAAARFAAGPDEEQG